MEENKQSRGKSLIETAQGMELSGSTLKVIAVLSMIVDHWCYLFAEQGTDIYEIGRMWIGRVAFPFPSGRRVSEDRVQEEVWAEAAFVCFPFGDPLRSVPLWKGVFYGGL